MVDMSGSGRAGVKRRRLAYPLRGTVKIFKERFVTGDLRNFEGNCPEKYLHATCSLLEATQVSDMKHTWRFVDAKV